MPACGCPAGTCMRSMNSRLKRASSSRSGLPFLRSGMFIVPSAKSRAVLPKRDSVSYWFCSIQTAKPLSTTYLP